MPCQRARHATALDMTACPCVADELATGRYSSCRLNPYALDPVATRPNARVREAKLLRPPAPSVSGMLGSDARACVPPPGSRIPPNAIAQSFIRRFGEWRMLEWQAGSGKLQELLLPSSAERLLLVCRPAACLERLAVLDREVVQGPMVVPEQL